MKTWLAKSWKDYSRTFRWKGSWFSEDAYSSWETHGIYFDAATEIQGAQIKMSYALIFEVLVFVIIAIAGRWILFNSLKTFLKPNLETPCTCKTRIVMGKMWFKGSSSRIFSLSSTHSKDEKLSSNQCPVGRNVSIRICRGVRDCLDVTKSLKISTLAS